MCNKPRNLPGLPRAAVWLLLAGIRLSLAAGIPAMPPAPNSLLVGDLLRIDAERARAAELAKAAGLAPVGAPASGFSPINASPASPTAGVSPPVVPGLSAVSPEPATPAVSLAAIYGVGARLLADVSIQGQRVTYAAGRAQPIRASDPHTAYRLRAIRPPCVQLEPGHGDPVLELCLGARP